MIAQPHKQTSEAWAWHWLIWGGEPAQTSSPRSHSNLMTRLPHRNTLTFGFSKSQTRPMRGSSSAFSPVHQTDGPRSTIYHPVVSETTEVKDLIQFDEREGEEKTSTVRTASAVSRELRCESCDVRAVCRYAGGA